jgi:aspartyl-tRNA(Asn)/glutamyl-tRNA(Gln) amidotransferase subunit B
MELEPIIGLEIHVQLKTKSKMFCSCDNTGEDKPANTTVCPVCMGHPGVLPVANRQAIEWSVMSALALGCQIPEFSKFDRKNYFYPDLPKGYQISQYDKPIGVNGSVIIETKNGQKEIRLTRLHLEEDAAKLLHSPDGKWSYVDYNRSSTPLMEVVTEPDIRTPEEAKIFIQELRLLMRHLGVSLADMEKGHLRCDANISLRPLGQDKFFPKTEIKNINSFKAVERALEYEIKRQTKLWEEGQAPEIQSTRGWDEAKQITEEQRTKEEAHDYRYFPEPDLPPLLFTPEWVEEIRTELPELPQKKRMRFIEMYEMNPADAKIITEEKELANYTEEVISELKDWLGSLEEMEGTKEEIWHKNKKKLVKLVSGWLINKLMALLYENNIVIKDCIITPENFAELITMIYQAKVNGTTAQTILAEMFRTGIDPSHALEEKDLAQISDDKEIENIINRIIASNPEPVLDYKNGKIQAIKFLVGQIMRETKGKVNPQTAEELLKNKLK